MKVSEIYFEKADAHICYYIGQNAQDNFFVLDNAKPDDLWFHLEDMSSCHVVASIPEHHNIDRKTLKQIIKTGALLCKTNTLKARPLHNINVMYTTVKNVSKSPTCGTVHAEKAQTISV
jgi:predicted ribosome quality control (RQC) complex YloA/Tae2 family protein